MFKEEKKNVQIDQKKKKKMYKSYNDPRKALTTFALLLQNDKSSYTLSSL
jgi:hypothetical protein